MREQWKQIDYFPNYAVSNFGRVMNLRTEMVKTPSANQQGIANVLLMADGTQFRRSVAVLVAKAFLPIPDREAFDTPINLDGDRFNNHVDNLMWRPRWFAVKYHLQMKLDDFRYDGSCEIIETGEKFRSTYDLCTTHGLLEKEVVLGAHNNMAIFPTWFHVRLN